MFVDEYEYQTSRVLPRYHLRLEPICVPMQVKRTADPGQNGSSGDDVKVSCGVPKECHTYYYLLKNVSARIAIANLLLARV